MIREYALDPTLLVNWKDFRYFVEKFSVAQGRLISEFPKHWKRMVWEACGDCPYLDKARITEKMKSMDDRLWRRSRRYDASEPWRSNAIRSHTDPECSPFHAIVTGGPVTGCDELLLADDVDDSHPLWKEKHSTSIGRTAGEIAQIATPLLEISREIIFIDPYFKPWAKRFQLPLANILASLIRLRRAVPERLEYHVSDGGKDASGPAPFAAFDQECRSRLPRLIPRGLELKFVRWKQSSMHNRYILTDRGAIDFGTGLDEARAIGTKRDTPALLDEAVRQELWNAHVHGTGPTKLVAAGDPKPVVVVGTA